MSEIEAVFTKLSMKPNVEGIILVDNDGTPLKSTMQHSEQQTHYAHLITALAIKARHLLRDLDKSGTGDFSDLTFLRVRTLKNEILVSPEKDYILIVIQRFPDPY